MLPPGRYLDLWLLAEARGIAVTANHVELGALHHVHERASTRCSQAEFHARAGGRRVGSAHRTVRGHLLAVTIANAWRRPPISPPALLALRRGALSPVSVTLETAGRCRSAGFASLAALKKCSCGPEPRSTVCRLPRLSGASRHMHSCGNRSARRAQDRICMESAWRCGLGDRPAVQPA